MTTPFLFVPAFSWPAAPGGKLHTYAAGGTTPQGTWSDAAGTAANTNPVTLDANGTATIRLTSGLAYHMVLKDSTDTITLWDEDNYQASYLTQSDIGGLLYTRTAAEIAAAVTPTNFVIDTTQYGDIRRYYATNNPGVTDQTAAVQAAINTGVAEVLFPPESILVTSGFTLTRSVLFRGIGSPTGGVGATSEPASNIIKNFNGDLFTFNASQGSLPGSGGGVRDLRLVQASGSGITAGGAGTAIKIIGTSVSNRPSWMKFDNVLIEYGVGKDSWTWGIDIDGTAITGGTILDLWFSRISCHTASSSGGAARFKAATAKMFDCAFYDTAGNVTITGIAGTPSSGVVLFNTDISGTLAFDWASDCSVFGGNIATITNTANTGGNCTVIPARLINAFTSANNNAGAHFGVFSYNTQAFATAVGSWRLSQVLALENAQAVHGINSGGTSALRLIRTNAANRVEISGDGADIQFGQGTVGNGGGSAPTLGTIGGSGPASAPQGGWAKFFDSAGNAFYLPFWR